MFARAVNHVRHNAVAYLALFIAMSGTAYAVGLPRNSVSSPNIVNGEVKRVDIARNAVNAPRVKDVARAISIPLGSFADCEDPAVGRDLDWTNDVDANADRAISSNLDRVIRWDDSAGQGDDQSTVCSEFTVPPDAVDDFALRVNAGKQQESGPTTEQITANLSGFSHTEDMVAGTAQTSYVFPTDIGFTSGDTIRVSVTAHAAAGSLIDDSVEVHAVDFVYRSRQ